VKEGFLNISIEIHLCNQLSIRWPAKEVHRLLAIRLSHFWGGMGVGGLGFWGWLLSLETPHSPNDAAGDQNVSEQRDRIERSDGGLFVFCWHPSQLVIFY
jgi:hypothetical protein